MWSGLYPPLPPPPPPPSFPMRACVHKPAFADGLRGVYFLVSVGKKKVGDVGDRLPLKEKERPPLRLNG